MLVSLIAHPASRHCSYGDTLNRNNLTMAQNNTFNTLGRNQRNLNHSTPHHGNNNANHAANNININNGHLHNGHAVGQEVVANTLGRNNRYNDVPITNPLFHIRYVRLAPGTGHPDSPT